MDEEQTDDQKMEVLDLFKEEYILESLQKLEEGDDFEVLEESVEENGEVKVLHNETGLVLTVSPSGSDN